MFDLLDSPVEVADLPNAPALQLDSSQIRFDNVYFRYAPDRPVLRGISFEVPAGKTVAIVGPSGAGKSTISRLLYRFYDTSEGQITIDGQDIKTVRQDVCGL